MNTHLHGNGNAVCATFYRPECPLHSAQCRGSWLSWWSLQGWHPIGQNEGRCPKNKNQPHTACTAAWTSPKTSQPGMRRLREQRGCVGTCTHTHTHTVVVLTAVSASGRRRKVWAGAWRPRDGDPPSCPCAVTLCVLVVVLWLHDDHTHKHTQTRR